MKETTALSPAKTAAPTHGQHEAHTQDFVAKFSLCLRLQSQDTTSTYRVSTKVTARVVSVFEQ